MQQRSVPSGDGGHPNSHIQSITLIQLHGNKGVDENLKVVHDDEAS